MKLRNVGLGVGLHFPNSPLDPPMHVVSQMSARERGNEWYPRGIQISLDIRSPGLQDYDGGGGVFWSKLWASQI